MWKNLLAQFAVSAGVVLRIVSLTFNEVAELLRSLLWSKFCRLRGCDTNDTGLGWDFDIL